MEQFRLGLEKIEWALKNMPVLSKLNYDFSKTKPLNGANISMSIHLEAKTAFLALCLKNAGANVSICGSNPLSTQDDVCAGLAHMGVNVNAKHAESAKEYIANLEKTLSGCPDVIMDDGGDMTKLVHFARPDLGVNICGGCEETTTGIMQLRKMQKNGTLNFPMVDVNGATMKHLFDNRYGTGQSVISAIMSTTNLVIASKTVVVAGYGWCGRGIAMRAAGLGAKVVVTEIDPAKAIEAAMDGFEVMSMDYAALLGDIFITVTGCDNVITERHFHQMKDGVILCNAGHFDVEVNIDDLDDMCEERYRVRNNIECFETKQGKKFYLLGEGRLVNLACGDGHPAEIMDLSFSLQMLTIIHLWNNGKNLKKKLYEVPKEIDDLVASLKLEAMGLAIDKLTDEQARYLYGE